MMHNIDLDRLIEQLEKREADDSLGEVTLSYRERENVVFYLRKLAEKKEEKMAHYLITGYREKPKRELDQLMRVIARGNYSEKNHDFVYIALDLLEDVFCYLQKLKNISEIPPLGKKPDYVPLSFHELADMIGEPVFIKPSGCKGYWDVVCAVKKDHTGEFVMFKGCKDDWRRISDIIYRSREGAEEDVR